MIKRIYDLYFNKVLKWNRQAEIILAAHKELVSEAEGLAERVTETYEAKKTEVETLSVILKQLNTLKA